MLKPIRHVGTQPVEVEIGERAISAVQVAQGALQHRARADMVVPRLVVEGYRQLHHALDVTAKVLLRGAAARPVLRQGTPHVLENFVSVEKVSAVEEIDPPGEVVLIFILGGKQRHNRLSFTATLHLATTENQNAALD